MQTCTTSSAGDL